MKLKCPNCGAPIAAADINVKDLIAVCGACDQIFPFERPAVTRKAKPRKLIQPERIQVDEADDQISFSYQRVYGESGQSAWGMVTLGAVFMTIFAVAALAVGAVPGMAVLGIVALFLWYFTAVFAFNTTRIKLNDDELIVTSGPLRFPFKDGIRPLNTADIERFWVDTDNETGDALAIDNNVLVERRDGIKKPMVGTLPPEYAHYIVGTLNNFLLETDELSDELHDLDVEADTLSDDGELDPVLAAALDDAAAVQSQQVG